MKKLRAKASTKKVFKSRSKTSRSMILYTFLSYLLLPCISQLEICSHFLYPIKLQLSAFQIRGHLSYMLRKHLLHKFKLYINVQSYKQTNLQK